MRTTLIITTYNWPQALKLVLDSVESQDELPDEVIVADDGSTVETEELIKQYQRSFAVPLIHSWQEDNGFRLAASRNKAIAKASGDYIIMVDGDVVLHPRFIETHKMFANRGWMIQGKRVRANEKLSQIMLKENRISWPCILDPRLGHRKHGICSPQLSMLLSKRDNSSSSTKGCNMSYWQEDAIKVNGFNEDFIGWGAEDEEFSLRLSHSGVSRLCIKYAANMLHIHHNEAIRDSLLENKKILHATKKNKLVVCENGVGQYINN